LAEFACDSGHPKEAEPLERAAMKTYQDQNQPDDEMVAAALLSRSLVGQGKREEAAASLEAPLKLAQRGSDVSARLSLALAHANVLAAMAHPGEAEVIARRVLAEAPKDLFRVRLEASLTLGNVETNGKNPAQGRQRLLEVSRTAGEKGFELIARHASETGPR
jgi:hypothetical protein